MCYICLHACNRELQKLGWKHSSTALRVICVLLFVELADQVMDFRTPTQKSLHILCQSAFFLGASGVGCFNRDYDDDIIYNIPELFYAIYVLSKKTWIVTF
jgi:hypothetical protein